MKARKKVREPRVTAQLKPIISEASAAAHATEEGLSVDPEELGQSFLRYATEQGNFESTQGAGPRGLFPQGEPPTDAALQGTHFSADATVWDATVDLVVENDGVDAVTNDIAPPLPDGESRAPAERGFARVDLTKSVIEEASLLDEESEQLGETIPKDSRTEDTGGHSGRADDNRDEAD
jgi:hypothetical protein